MVEKVGETFFLTQQTGKKRKSGKDVFHQLVLIRRLSGHIFGEVSLLHSQVDWLASQVNTDIARRFVARLPLALAGKTVRAVVD